MASRDARGRFTKAEKLVVTLIGTDHYDWPKLLVNVIRFTEGRMSRGDFDAWFHAQDFDADSEKAAGRVGLILAEFDRGHWSQVEMIDQLRDAIRVYPDSAETENYQLADWGLATLESARHCSVCRHDPHFCSAHGCASDLALELYHSEAAAHANAEAIALVQGASDGAKAQVKPRFRRWRKRR